MSNFTVQIITTKSEICALIKKTLDADRYTVHCTTAEIIDEEFLNGIDKMISCLILDKGLDEAINKKIKSKFQNTPIICLPFLGSESVDTNGVKYMSEPFKLSELKKAVEEIYEKIEKSEN